MIAHASSTLLHASYCYTSLYLQRLLAGQGRGVSYPKRPVQ